MFRPPSLDIERILDVDARRLAFEARFGVEREEDAVVFTPPQPPPLPQGNELGVFGNALQSEAVRRLRAAQGVPSREPIAPEVRQNEQLSLAEQAVARQKEMAARRKAKAGVKGEEEKEKEGVRLPPSNPHMQAIFEAVRQRAKIVDQQIEDEKKRLAEEQANQPEVVLTEEELEQQRIKAEALAAERKRQSEELKAEKQRLAEERAKLNELKKNLHAGITGNTTPLKKTRLPKKRARNHSFAGTETAHVEAAGPIHRSLVLVPDYKGEPLDLNTAVDEDGNWDNLEPLFADIEAPEEQAEADKKEEQPQSNSWLGYLNPSNWFGGGGAPAETQQTADVPPTPAELIWNEIAEIVQLIDIGLPQNMLDSVADVGPGVQFFQGIRTDWNGEFHRYLYYPALVRVIRARYEAAGLIVAEHQIAMQSDNVGQTMLEQMGEALDYIDEILTGVDAWMQRHSTRVAQNELNPGPTDFLITEFPHFTESMTRSFKQLKELFNQKRSTYEGFDSLQMARAHMFESMTFVDSELKQAEAKVQEARRDNDEKPLPSDALSLDD